jgi:hypothetical protein
MSLRVRQAKARRRPAAKSANAPLLLAFVLAFFFAVVVVVALISRAEVRLRWATTSALVIY